MRLTINLDDDLYAMARSHAIATKTSISKAVGDLLRRRATTPPAVSFPASGVHPLSGFPISQGDGRAITNDDVRKSMDDDLIGPMVSMGQSEADTQKALK